MARPDLFVQQNYAGGKTPLAIPPNKPRKQAQTAPTGTGFPATRKIDLTNARALEPWYIGGQAIFAEDATDNTGAPSATPRLFVSFSPTSEPVPFAPGQYLASDQPFDVVYLTNAAQAGCTMWVSVGASGFKGH